MSTRSERPPPRRKEDGRALRRALTKPSDGMVSRVLNRRISVPISRRLARTRVTPNQISIFNLLVGFGSAILAATGDRTLLGWSGILFQLGSILDGCDGEVAHLKQQATPKGAWVDTLTDNLSYVAFCLGVTVGLYRRVDQLYIAVFGGAATFAIVGSLALMYTTLARHDASGSLLRFGDAAMRPAREGRGSLFTRVISRVEFMIRRDFFALLFCVLAMFDRLDWIFWLVVTGSIGLMLSVLSTYRRVTVELQR